MTKKFETPADRVREELAILTFVNSFRESPGFYSKLPDNDIDYRVSDNNGTPIACVEVKGRLREMADAYPLPVGVLKLAKLIERSELEDLEPVIVWACTDGIIYGRVWKLEGRVRWGGREPRPGATHDAELMTYYFPQAGMKFVPYRTKTETAG
jgi:hypothetical protein